MKQYHIMMILLSLLLFMSFTVYMIYPFFQGVSTNKPTIILILIFLWVITLSFAIFIFIGWRSGSPFPLFTFIILIGIWVFALVFSERTKIQPERTMNFIAKNFGYYSEFISERKAIFNEEEGFYQLPYNYRFLSENGKIEVIKRNNVSHVFFTMRSSLGYREVLELSQIDQSFYEGDRYSKVIRLRKNWFFITQQ